MLNPVGPDLLSRLAERLPPEAFPEGDTHLSEPRGRYVGLGHLVAPSSVEEVATVVRACAEARVGIVPHGGGTGLVGGQVMPEGPAPLVVSLARMNRIRAMHPSENVMIAEAGVILADVQAAAVGSGRMFPLSLASGGSARVGGLLATNAGGTQVLRWGNARALCLGVEAVTATGAIWHGLSRLRKDNAGYDLRDLLIGSEGTLGIITAASLRLVQPPAGIGVALLAVPSPAHALDLLALAQAAFGDAVEGIELIGRMGFDFLAETGLGACPLDPVPEWSVLIELGLPEGLDPQAALERVFEAGLERSLVTDGVLAASAAQGASLWQLRENIPEANRRIGSISSHDISLPLSEIAGFLADGSEALAAIGPLRINAFAPKGRSRTEFEGVRGRVKEVVHDLVHASGGSVAAEHGVGRLKVADLERYGDPVKLAMMRAVKAALDPDGILNPGAVLRAQ